MAHTENFSGKVQSTLASVKGCRRVHFPWSRLGGSSHMGLDAQGKPGGKASKHSGAGFDVHSVLQGQADNGVLEIVKSYPE